MIVFKVLFIGVGSIARQHILNLHAIAERRGMNIEIDAFRRSISADIPEGVSHVYHDYAEVPKDYDAVFITNPTDAHLAALERFRGSGRNFFIEKPIVSIPEITDAEKFKLRDDAIYYVACPLRYNAVIQHIRETVDPADVFSVRSISSSYLPDWRPGQDYRNTYSAHRDMGGGVGIDLIHEWDYITYLFGWPDKVFCLAGKKSDLEIDSDDYAIYIAEYADKIAEVHLDYFGRKTIREVQLFTKDDTITGDIANSRVTYLKSGRVIDFHEERKVSQQRELEHFIDMVFGKAANENGFEHSIKVLRLTQGI